MPEADGVDNLDGHKHAGNGAGASAAGDTAIHDQDEQAARDSSHE